MTPEVRALLKDLAEFENQRGISRTLLEFANRAAAILAAEKPAGRTVRVRVAAWVVPDGQWNAVGWSGGGSDHEVMEDARSFFGGAAGAGAFLTADVLIPDGVPEIAANVEVVR